MLCGGSSGGALVDPPSVAERRFALLVGFIVVVSRDEAMISLMRLPGSSLRTVLVSRSPRFFGREKATTISSNTLCPRRCLLYRWWRVFLPKPLAL
jgi:hypothetical protein